jgi:hypothetical protein
VSKVVGATLTPALQDRLSQRDLAWHLGEAMPFVTIDGAGRPHPMLISYLEVRAYDMGSVGLVIQAATDSAHNLELRNAATLIVVDANVVAYVKLRRLDGPLPVVEDERLAYFMLSVEEVRQDQAAEAEGDARMTTGPRFEPLPDLSSAWALATLAAVKTPRARA